MLEYSHLEKTLLLSLKQLRIEVLRAGGRPQDQDIVPGSYIDLWEASDKAFKSMWEVKPVSEAQMEVIKDKVLDVVGCNMEDVRVAIEILRNEGLIKYKDYHHHLTERGYQVCRELESGV